MEDEAEEPRRGSAAEGVIGVGVQVAVEAAAEAAGGAVEAVAGGCAEGCGGCVAAGFLVAILGLLAACAVAGSIGGR